MAEGPSGEKVGMEEVEGWKNCISGWGVFYVI